MITSIPVLIRPDMNFVVDTAAAQIKRADESRKEALISTGETTFGEPWVQNICDEEIDRSVTVMQFKDKAGKNIASLTRFAVSYFYGCPVYRSIS